MIAYLNGSVLRKEVPNLVIETNGVGYLVNVLPQLSARLTVGESVSLHTAHIFREDSQSLFGFENAEELSIFQLLCTVTGVGPKSALAIVGQLGVDGVAEAVSTANDDMFRSVSGIGPKTAKLIVLNLTGKLVKDGPGSSSVHDQVLSALTNLGYLEKTAKEAIKNTEANGNFSSEGELLKAVLALLSNSRKGL